MAPKNFVIVNLSYLSILQKSIIQNQGFLNESAKKCRPKLFISLNTIDFTVETRHCTDMVAGYQPSINPQMVPHQIIFEQLKYVRWFCARSVSQSEVYFVEKLQ